MFNTIIGTAGDDNLTGTNGDDLINPIDNFGGYDQILGSTGNDTIDYSFNGSGYQELNYNSLSAGIVANLDIGANTATVDKGANGTDTIINVENPLIPGFSTNGGFALYATGHDDTINITQVNERWMQTGGGAGNDTFNITLNGGTVRLDYRAGTQGVNINLGTGVVSEDGFGSSDTINLTRAAGATAPEDLIEVRGTSFADTIVGSDGQDSFILLGGDDSLDGGAGIDRLGYDRGGFDGVDVDLAAGTATGNYNGTAFTHTISNIEIVRGSNGGSDVLRGDSGVNYLSGRDGDDTLMGRGGDDTLFGGSGIDVAVFTGARSEYVITLNANGGLDVAHSGADGTDTLIYVNRAQFSDQLLDLDVLREDLLSGGVTITGDTNTVTPYGDWDYLSGGTGNDTISGFGSPDQLFGNGGNDTLFGGDGDDMLTGGGGDDSIDGGNGTDSFIVDASFADATISENSGVYSLTVGGDTDTVTNVESFVFSDMTVAADDLIPAVTVTGTAGADVLEGGSGTDILDGGAGNDILRGGAGNDTLNGGDGADTLNGGDGDDFIFGGDSMGDLRDVVFAGAGNDSIDAGYGNDLVFGQDGNDTVAGGFGSDTLQGQNGNDVLTGSALSDVVFGGAGDDFVNGGFGHDRINGGSGADRFFHLGIRDHGSDFIQDYNSAEGDVLLTGIVGATRSDFQVNINDAVNPAGEAAGDDNVQEAFVIYRPTGQILWALIDGAGQPEINLRIGSDVFDLLA